MTVRTLEKSKKTVTFFIKLTIITLSWIFVAERIINSPDIFNFGDHFVKNGLHNAHLLVTIIVLMGLNWSLETIKWKYLIKKIENISFLKAFKAVWSGITTGTITPNRIGEFGGRIVFLKVENRKKAIIITLVGDLSQMLITLIMGILGAAILVTTCYNKIAFFQDYKLLFFGTAAIVAIICLILFFDINNVLKKLIRFKFLAKYLQKYIPEEKISLKNKIGTLFLSFFRYLIFCFQFYLALQYFDINIGLIQSFAAISSMYLAIHIFPSFIIAEIGLRLSFALLFFRIFTDKTIAISLASLLIYIINIVIPMIFGSIFLFKNKTN